MLANFLSRFYHACWYFTAAVIITAAVIVTILRLMLPQIDEYRPRIENWISEKSGYNITLDQLEAHWQGWTPTLNMNGIQVSDPADGELLMSLESASITLDPLLNLREQDLAQLQISIAGPRLLIIREKDGSIELAKIETSGQSQPETDQQFFKEWVMQQRSIAIVNASITFIDSTHSNAELSLSQVNLKLRTSGKRTQIEATAMLPEEYGDRINFSLDAFGDITSPGWSGRIYLEGDRINPAGVLSAQDITPAWQTLSDTPLAIRIWTDWSGGRLEKISGSILTQIEGMEPAKPDTDYLDANFSLARDEDENFRSRIHINRFRSEHGDWQPAVIDIFRRQDNNNSGPRYEIAADYLKVDDILPVLNKVEPGLLAYDEREISGELHNTRIRYAPAQDRSLYFASDINFLSISGQLDESNITATGGRIAGTPDGGLLQLQAGTVSLSLPGIFNREINFYEINGDFSWTDTEYGMLLETDHFATHTPHFNSTGKVKILFSPEQQSPLVDMQLSQTNLNLEHLLHYMPSAVHEDVLDWMANALVAGDIKTMDVLLRGYLHEFPYAGDEGRFQVKADVRDSRLAYHPDWLPVTGLDADFQLDNNRIRVHTGKGSVHEARIEEAEAVIPDITAKKPVLDVSSRYSGNTEQARYIINNSPLSKSGTLARINEHNINGKLKLLLDLHIPLTGDDRMSFNGELSVTETEMESPKLGMALNDINGVIRFTRESIASDSLHGLYAGQPVSLNISTDNQSRLVLALEGTSGSRFISSRLVRFFPGLAPLAGKLQDYLQGETAWKASLAPGDNEDSNKYAAVLTISTDLAGLSMDFPAPLAKDTGPAPLQITTTIGTDDAKTIRIAYNNELLAGIEIINNGTVSLRRAEIALGNGTRLFNTGNGLFIHGNVDSLSLSGWQDFIQSLDTGKEDNDPFNIQVDLQADTLTYLDQQFSNTDFRVNNLQPDLYLTLEGNGIDGKVILPDNLDTTPVRANFSTLHLQENESESNGMDIDPLTKPPLEMTVNDFTYGNIRLGEMSLNTSRLENGLSIDSIRFSKKGLKIEGNGSWVVQNNEPRSEFIFKLRANKLETMLSTFDYSVSPVKDGKTKMNINANWHGSPMDFSLAGINGSLEMNIEKGQFLDIEPAAGRLFGLLSLQTIPRRLALDFSDLFGEGFSFDQIDGTFFIESGNAYTNNLTMSGPSANIQVNGRTGLIEKDYDQVVTVVPQVSSSLPVAGALFGPIGIGVGAVLFLAGELFESIPRQIDQLLRYQYSVKGSWEDPQVERISATTSQQTEDHGFQ